MPNFVQEYRSTDLPAWPNLTGQAGSGIALLDALLVNGGPTSAVTSLTESGATITAVIPANTTLETNDYLVIAGASPAGANGTFKITATDSTHFSYTGPGSLGTITGTITYKRASLGWTKPYSGTNLAAYLPAAVSGFPQFCLRVDETGATAGGQRECAVRGYETMTDVNTGTGPFPTVAQQASGLCWRKSTSLDATARPWTLIGDGVVFYFVVNSDNSLTNGRTKYGFGGFVAFKPGDLYNEFITGNLSFNTGNGSGGFSYVGMINNVSANGIYCPRLSTQVAGGCVLSLSSRSVYSSGTFGAGYGFLFWPNSIDGALWVDSLLLFEGANLPRGRPRGLYMHCHYNIPNLVDYDLVTNIAGLSGITLLNVVVAHGSVTGQALFDKYGPW